MASALVRRAQQQGLHLLLTAAAATALPGTASGHGHRDVGGAYFAAAGNPEAGDGALMLHSHVAAGLMTALILSRFTRAPKRISKPTYHL